ncbi:MAG: alginate lyase family protein [bacterium]
MNFRYYLHRMVSLTPREALRRGVALIGRNLYDKAAEIAARFIDTTISDEDFLRTAFVAGHLFQDTMCRMFRERKKPAFFPGALFDPSTAAGLETSREDIIRGADRICDHVFNLLGSGNVHLGKFIEWQGDFKSGYRWDENKYYKNIEMLYGRADIKVPWEFSQFQHLISLGQAYRLTGDEKYTREFMRQVNDWIDRNKPRFGVNWASTREVAIRVCNWTAGFFFFQKSPELTDDFLVKFVKSLFQHGKHIRSNLEDTGLTTNHYLADIAGLLYLGVFVPEFWASEGWRKFSIAELKKEMMKQVYHDGCDFEASTCYHRFVLELFFFLTLSVVINDDSFDGGNHRAIAERIFGKEYTERLFFMFEAVITLLKPNGMMPQIGDNDNSRLHRFAQRPVLDMRYLLALGALFFQEPKFKVKEFGFPEEALWVFGEAGYRMWQGLKGITLAEVKSKSLPDAGWYVMRDHRDYLLVSCGPNGQNGNGGHCHNDKLSFELHLDGEDVIVDPGTFVYTPDPEMRNLFRSTALHNTIMVDEEEQNRTGREHFSLFSMKDDARVKVKRWVTGTEREIFVGEHVGYARGSRPVVHEREIRFHKREGKFEIIDRLRGRGEHRFQWNLILAPDLNKELEIGPRILPWEKGYALYSGEYGKREETVKLTATVTKTLPFEASFRIRK